jgi:F-type H+-transporting ATPase subunit g
MHTHIHHRDIATFQGYIQPAINAARQPTTLFSKLANSPYAQPTEALNTVRNISGPQLLATGVLVAEVIGFFTIGEIIGRFKLVGYRSSAPADH